MNVSTFELYWGFGGGNAAAFESIMGGYPGDAITVFNNSNTM